MIQKIQLFLFLVFAAGFSQPDSLKTLAINLSNYEYPYEVSFLKVENQQQEMQMAYMDIKPNNYNGKNFLLLHGKNFNGAYWESTIEKLTALGYRVIVPDQIGFGKSSKPLQYQYSFHQLAANTNTLLDSLKIEKTTVLGHSMGGMLATRFTLIHPEKADRLILVNPIGLEDYKLKIPYKSIDWWYNNELKKDYESIKEYQKKNYYDGKWKPAYNEWVNILAGWTLNDNYKIIAWNAALTYDMIVTQPVVYEFQNIAVPTLLIIGTRDRTALGKPLVPENIRKTMGRYDKLGEKTKAKIPNAELIEIENTGHLPHIENPNVFFSQLEEYLKKHDKL